MRGMNRYHYRVLCRKRARRKKQQNENVFYLYIYLMVFIGIAAFLYLGDIAGGDKLTVLSEDKISDKNVCNNNVQAVNPVPMAGWDNIVQSMFYLALEMEIPGLSAQVSDQITPARGGRWLAGLLTGLDFAVDANGRLWPPVMAGSILTAEISGFSGTSIPVYGEDRTDDGIAAAGHRDYFTGKYHNNEQCDRDRKKNILDVVIAPVKEHITAPEQEKDERAGVSAEGDNEDKDKDKDKNKDEEKNKNDGNDEKCDNQVIYTAGGDISTRSDEKLPMVLIYHSHITETFYPDTGENFTTNLELTVARLGRMLAKNLADNYGIPVMHHTGMYDIPRRLAYQQARPHIKDILENNPEIEIVIDLHRDGVVRRVTTTTYEGNEICNLLLVVGSGYSGWEGSFKYGLQLQKELDKIDKNISRGVRPQGLTYNQDLHDRAILLEVGGHENTIKEAEAVIPLVAKAVAGTYYALFPW